MSQSLSLQPVPAAEPRGIVELRIGPVWWRCIPEQREWLENSRLEWQNIAEAPGLEIVKHNSHRTVWHVQTGGTDLYLKVYRPHDLLARLKGYFRGSIAEMEWDVAHYAAEHDIPAVRPIGCGWLKADPRGGPSWLLTAAVPHAKPLGEYWLSIQDRPASRRNLVDVVARLVARAHQCGFHHRDMHAGNILVRLADATRPEAFFVDLHNVQIGRDVPTPTVIANLAQLNQWFRWHASRSDRLSFLKRYLAYRDQYATASRFARNWQSDLRKLLRDLDRRATLHAGRLWAKRDRRTNRDGRYFSRVSPARGWSGYAVLACKHSRPGAPLGHMTFDRRFWQEALSEPRTWLSGDDVTVLKDSHTSMVTRRIIRRDGADLSVIVKRPRPRSLLKRIAQWLGHSRIRRTWMMANRLIHRDLPTAHPLVLLEKHAAGLFRVDGLLLTEAIENAFDLEAFVTLKIAALPATARRASKDAVIAAIVRLLRAFTERGFVHRDFKATNVMICPPPDGDVFTDPRPVLIDLDGVFHRPHRRREPAMWRAIMRLGVSLQHVTAVTRTDRLRVLKSLLRGPGRTDRDWKKVWRDLATLTDRKLSAKEQRRRWKMEHYGRE